MMEASTSSTTQEFYLMKMIETRAAEISALDAECKVKMPKLSAQRLPRYMRRRAASHNPKRLPKSIRWIGKKKEDENKTKTNTKNKNKKYRNKDKQAESREKRVKKADRSGLHVWFAKRFKMQEMWHELVPLYNNTKNQRSLFRNAKKNVVFYYLSFWKCLSIGYVNSTKDQLLEFISNFTNHSVCHDFNLNFIDGDDHEYNERKAVLYVPNSYPHQIIASVHLLFNSRASKLWIWSHISVYENLYHQLSNFALSHYSSITVDRRLDLERFRIIGANSLPHLNSCFQFELKQLTNHVNAFNLNDKLNVASQLNAYECGLWKDEVGTENGQRSMILINKSDNKRQFYDIICHIDSTKLIWHTLIKNKAHLVGGWRDMKMLAFNCSSLMFPHIGYLDSQENQLMMSQMMQLSNASNLYVLRDASVLSSLSLHLHSSILNNIPNHDYNRCLVNIELTCVTRGVPHEYDHVCIPTLDDISKYVSNVNNPIDKFHGPNDNLKGAKDDIKSLSRQVVGIVEMGEFCMGLSRGKGLGVISMMGLKLIAQVNESAMNKKSNEYIYGLLKSNKSATYRFITIKVINSVFST